MKPRWGLGLGIGLATGLGLWILTGPPFEIRPEMPLFLWLWAPVTMVGILIYADWLGGQKKNRWWKAALPIWVVTIYALWIQKGLPTVMVKQYENLLLIHLPLLAWVGIGGYLLGWKAEVKDRFAVLVKSLELMVIAGLLLGVGGIFMGTTQMLFSTMDIIIPEVVVRFGVAVGLGLLALTVVMVGYEPRLKPREQNFKSGVYPIMVLAARLFIPFVLFVLVVYTAIIPFNFWIPFQDREALVTFNAILAAVMLLLIGATPVIMKGLTEKWLGWLRLGIVGIAILEIIITAYALTAAIYRTYIDQWTVNRVVVMGWNVVNMMVLGALVVGQIKAGKLWIEKMQQAWARAMSWWAGWVVGLILLLPLLFQ